MILSAFCSSFLVSSILFKLICVFLNFSSPNGLVSYTHKTYAALCFAQLLGAVHCWIISRTLRITIEPGTPPHALCAIESIQHPVYWVYMFQKHTIPFSRLKLLVVTQWYDLRASIIAWFHFHLIFSSLT